jgi:putative isomerase
VKGWLGVIAGVAGLAAGGGWAAGQGAPAASHVAPGQTEMPRSAEYAAVQDRLARGWNTWDVHSVATQVLLPEGLAIHVGMKHNTSENSDAWLGDALIGRLDKGAEVVMPGPHAWDGSYTSADYAWKGHKWRVESAHDGADLVMLVTPLGNAEGALPPTVVFSVDFLWNRAGAELKHGSLLRLCRIR